MILVERINDKQYALPMFLMFSLIIIAYSNFGQYLVVKIDHVHKFISFYEIFVTFVHPFFDPMSEKEKEEYENLSMSYMLPFCI